MLSDKWLFLFWKKWKQKDENIKALHLHFGNTWLLGIVTRFVLSIVKTNKSTNIWNNTPFGPKYKFKLTFEKSTWNIFQIQKKKESI